MSLPMTFPPARGAGITKSPVTGLRRFNKAIATSEMQAVSVALAHCALGIEFVIDGLRAPNAARTFSFVLAPSMSWSACGVALMLLAVGTNPVSACVR